MLFVTSILHLQKKRIHNNPTNNGIGFQTIVDYIDAPNIYSLKVFLIDKWSDFGKYHVKSSLDS